jgi:predicted outer membrane repeat protein
VNLNGDDNLIINSLFDENNAIHDDGAIYNKGNHMLLHDNLLFKNNANNDGGALYSDNAFTDFYHNQFEENACAGYGGAVYADRISTMSVGNVNQFTNNHAGKDGNDFITEDDKTAKANAGIVGYSIAAFLIAVVATVATIASWGAAAPTFAGMSVPASLAELGITAPMIGNTVILIVIGAAASGIEFGITELIKSVNKEFDDYCKEHPGIIWVIGFAMNIIRALVGFGIANVIARLGVGLLASIMRRFFASAPPLSPVAKFLITFAV